MGCCFVIVPKMEVVTSYNTGRPLPKRSVFKELFEVGSDNGKKVVTKELLGMLMAFHTDEGGHAYAWVDNHDFMVRAGKAFGICGFISGRLTTRGFFHVDEDWLVSPTKLVPASCTSKTGGDVTPLQLTPFGESVHKRFLERFGRYPGWSKLSDGKPTETVRIVWKNPIPEPKKRPVPEQRMDSPRPSKVTRVDKDPETWMSMLRKLSPKDKEEAIEHLGGVTNASLSKMLEGYMSMEKHQELLDKMTEFANKLNVLDSSVEAITAKPRRSTRLNVPTRL